MRRMKTIIIGLVTATVCSGAAHAGDHSVARQWNELLLEAIRNDFARPTVHARNLFHVSLAMWDSWAAYDCFAHPWLIQEDAPHVDDIEAAREETLSHAVFQLLNARFSKSPGADKILPLFRDKMIELGYDPDYAATVGATPAAFGNRIAVNVLFFGLNDNSNEQGGYGNLEYEPINPPLLPALPGNPDMIYPNRWQPLALAFFIDQSGNIIVGGYPGFLSPEWGQVTPFAMTGDDLTVYNRDGYDYWVYHDPGPPPLLESDEYYKWGFELVSMWSSHLHPDDGVMWDVSPASIGNAPLPETNEWADFYDRVNGGDWSPGYDMNPVTGEPYEPQIVPRGDYTRILAEFWADGPASETPPGHWFTILQYVSDHPLLEKRFGGEGEILGDLEWDVKSYFILGGAMHDVAISAWGVKGWYDYTRPISAIRYMCDRGQSSDPKGPSYDPDGINLQPGLIEVVTEETTAPGERHEHLYWFDEQQGITNIGKIAVLAWRGPDYIEDPETDVAGVGWILAENWWPYQRPTFVTPPFAGYVSGHSTYSRAAAEVMTLLTGSPYFPGGLGEFPCPQNEFLVFEDGPSVDVTLQWASYRDASDQCSLSRIWGGIHPPADDLPGRHMGRVIGPAAFDTAVTYFDGPLTCICAADFTADGQIAVEDLIALLAAWGECEGCPEDLDGDGAVAVGDLIILLAEWGNCQ